MRRRLGGFVRRSYEDKQHADKRLDRVCSTRATILLPFPSSVLLLISSSFIVVSLLPVSACFFFHLSGSEKKTNRYWRRDRTEPEEGWQGVSESAGSDKPAFGL